MKVATFKRGVHPPEKKEKTRDLYIEKAFPSTKTVVIPITQGGAPNEPLVSPGDTVARGQKIASSGAFVSAPVHASIAGVVKKVEPRLVVGNIAQPCVIIEGDDSGRTDYMPPLDPFSCSREEAARRVREAGITGMGGASFPACVKLTPPPDKSVQVVIANAAECEPYLTIDERLILERADKIIDGAAIEMRISGAQKGVIALEDNKADLAPILEKAIRSYARRDLDLVVRLCKTKYPQGGERMLVKAILDREIPAGGLPADVGCIVQNVGTLAAISDAFRLGAPLIDRGLTISGGSCLSPKNIEVPIGTLVGDLIPEVVSLQPGTVKIISGGPMMGFAMQNANFPIQKNTSGVLFLSEAESAIYKEDPCIGCGRCVKKCPCGLAPVLMIRALNTGNLERAKQCGLMDCMECGCCAYVCPSRVKLVQRIKTGKQLVREETLRRIEREKREKEKLRQGEA